MRGTVEYRQLVLRRDGDEALRLPLTAPVSDLLGLSKDDEQYSAYLSVRYGKTFATNGRGVLADAQKKDEEGNPIVVDAFLHAARSAAKGQLASSVGPYVERLRFAADGDVADVPDFVALAAWSLIEAVRRQRLKLITCPTCKRPWLGSPDGPKHCQRRAPGQMRDCRTLAKEKRLAGDSRYRSYRREYKRLEQAFRRRRVTAQELVAWRDENTVGKWERFPIWNARRQKGGSDA